MLLLQVEIMKNVKIVFELNQQDINAFPLQLDITSINSIEIAIKK